MAIEVTVNGSTVSLPDIPSDVLPYAVIGYAPKTGEYVCFATNSEIYVESDVLSCADETGYVIGNVSDDGQSWETSEFPGSLSNSGVTTELVQPMWANHDVLSGEEIVLADCAGVAVTVDGVSLPDIPGYVIMRYPYVAIVHYAGTGLKVEYVYWATKEPQLYLPAEIAALAGYTTPAYGCLTAYYQGVCGGDYGMGEWSENGETTTDVLLTSWLDAMTLVWANHDILTVTSLDTSTMEYTTGDVYFARNDVSYDEEYIVKSAFIIAMADKAREVSSTTDKLTTDKIQAAFDTLHSADGVEFG